MKKIQFSKRERTTLTWFVVIAVLGGLYVVTEGPRKEYLRSEKILKEAKLRVVETGQLRRQIEELRENEKELNEIKNTRGNNFDLWTFVNSAIKATDLRERADLRRNPRRGVSLPNNVAVAELTLTGVNLTEVVDLLHRVYKDESLIAVYAMNYLKPMSDSEKGLTCQIIFVSPK